MKFMKTEKDYSNVLHELLFFQTDEILFMTICMRDFIFLRPNLDCSY